MSASILDRLLDEDGAERGPTLREAQAAVRRDLHALLNARQPWASLPAPLGRLRDTMLHYGLPEFAAGAFNAREERDALCQQIAAAIRRFEPRLAQVRVSLRDRAEMMDPLLRIHIDAMLLFDGFLEPVGFESTLDVTTADMTVGPRSRG